MDSCIDAAFSYIRSGFPVIPLCWPSSKGECACGRNHQDRAIGKVPLTPNGLKDATLSTTKAQEYWTRWPKSNIGIVIPPGLFVLDIDMEHNGFNSLARMERECDFDLIPTWLVTTGSGGQHYYYKTPKPIRNTTQLGGYEGLDIRGLGGYTVGPPSLHRSGYHYKTSPIWNGGITLAPSKLINLCLKSSNISKPNQSVTGAIYLEGQRNDRLTRDAGAMRRRGLSERAIYVALQVVNQEQCQPPLPEREVEDIAKSISRYIPEAPKKRMGINL